MQVPDIFSCACMGMARDGPLYFYSHFLRGIGPAVLCKAPRVRPSVLPVLSSVLLGFFLYFHSIKASHFFLCFS